MHFMHVEPLHYSFKVDYFNIFIIRVQGLNPLHAHAAWLMLH